MTNKSVEYVWKVTLKGDLDKDPYSLNVAAYALTLARNDKIFEVLRRRDLLIVHEGMFKQCHAICFVSWKFVWRLNNLCNQMLTILFLRWWRTLECWWGGGGERGRIFIVCWGNILCHPDISGHGWLEQCKTLRQLCSRSNETHWSVRHLSGEMQ